VNGDEADTTSNTANWAVEPGQTKDVPITWYHYSDEAVSLNCNFLYPDVLDPVSSLIADQAGTSSGEVSFTTAEEVEDLPIILYGVIVFMVVTFAAFIAARARKEISKQYVADETHPTQEESEEEEQSDETEDQEEWLDADGNPVVATE